MGFTHTRAIVYHPTNLSKRRALEFLVDTGAYACAVPRYILKALGIKPITQRRFTLADGRHIIRDVGVALFKINGTIGSSEVIFGLAKDEPLIGVIALESIGLTVDPLKKRLKKTRHLLCNL